MVLFDGVFGLIALAVWIFCIVDVITTPPEQTRNLPKLVWLVLVVALVDIGSIAWLVAGRAWGEARVAVRAGAQRPGKRRATSPDDDDEFLATLDKWTEEQRRDHEKGDDVPPAG